MKIQTLFRAASLLFLTLVFKFSFAFGGGSIIGKVTDPITKEPVDGATVVLESEGTQKIYYTNESGYFYASNIPAGVYNITASYLSNRSTLPGIKLGNEEVKEIDIPLNAAIGLPPVVVGPERRIEITSKEGDMLARPVFTQQPIKTPIELTGNLPGVVTFNGEHYVRGARAGSLTYYIDGCRVMGNPNIPLCGLDTYRSYTAFVPAKYGDCTGGVIVMETRNFFGEQ